VQRKAFFLPPEPPKWCIELEKWPYNTAPWKLWLADKSAGKNPLCRLSLSALGALDPRPGS
jgi:hypothetical protein